jgi:hypothetical protein
MQPHDSRRRILWFCSTILLCAFVSTQLLQAAWAIRAMDGATEVSKYDAKNSNGYLAKARSQHQTKNAPKTGHQQNPGGPMAGNTQSGQQTQQTEPAQANRQLSGQQIVGNPPQKYQFNGLEGATAGVKPNLFEDPLTNHQMQYASYKDHVGDEALMNGQASPMAAFLDVPGGPQIAWASSELGSGGGSLDVVADDSLFPKGSCCMNAAGFFDMANPPECCKVNGTFIPFGAKPQCCMQQQQNNNNCGGGTAVSAGIAPMQPVGALHATTSGASSGAIAAVGAMASSSMESSPDSKCNSAKCDGQAKQGSRASAAGEDALRILTFCIEDYTQYLINVANENAGSPCSSRQPVKTYANVVWMVQQMYKHTYLPLAILFLLPGAVITQMKGLVGFGIIHARDDDTVSPFVGIFRAIIAIFLIPVTQLAVSYMIDIGNCCEEAVNKYVSMPLIFLWIEEQIVIFDPNQQGNMIDNIPNIPMNPLRGKFAGAPIKGAKMEQISGLDSALAELCNEAIHMLAIAMTVMSAFQIATVCYLFLVGPLAASFFAWPGVGRELFRRAFSSWLDAVVIVSLWKFWWCVVLAAWTIWLQSGVNPFDPLGPHWLVCWMSILISVPFNPFEFKPSEIIQHVMAKAEAVAAKVAQSGKGGGSGGGGKAKGKGGPAAG